MIALWLDDLQCVADLTNGFRLFLPYQRLGSSCSNVRSLSLSFLIIVEFFLSRPLLRCSCPDHNLASCWQELQRALELSRREAEEAARQANEYHLRAVVQHKGHSATAGHYVTDVRDEVGAELKFSPID